MADSPLLLAIDQGTTSSRAIVFDVHGAIRAIARRELAQHYPAGGWVEHDPEEIWSATLAVTREALAAADGAVAAIGITNQRETTVVWDRASGAPIHRAIVWQDRRTAARCRTLRDAGHEPAVSEQTGLLLDPCFSASKIAWILDHVDGARARAVAGDLAFGTIDTFLIWRLTGGAVHATDATNASRTLLFDIHAQAWDESLTGLGAPHWDPDARGAIYGLTRDTGPAHLARAALESVCFQTRDLMAAMQADRGAPIGRLRVDGGMAGNTWLLQTLADIVDVPVERPRIVETTALGAACLAGLQAGVFRSLDDIGARWARDAELMPRMSDRERERLVRGWESAVARTLEHRARTEPHRAAAARP